MTEPQHNSILTIIATYGLGVDRSTLLRYLDSGPGDTGRCELLSTAESVGQCVCVVNVCLVCVCCVWVGQCGISECGLVCVCVCVCVCG